MNICPHARCRFTSLAITACPRRRIQASAEVPPRRGRLQQARASRAASTRGQPPPTTQYHHHHHHHNHCHSTQTNPQPPHKNNPSLPEPRLGFQQTDTHLRHALLWPLPSQHARALTFNPSLQSFSVLCYLHTEKKLVEEERVALTVAAPRSRHPCLRSAAASCLPSTGRSIGVTFHSTIAHKSLRNAPVRRMRKPTMLIHKQKIHLLIFHRRQFCLYF